MKVGLIGLGRMGEGMSSYDQSRYQVHGYRNNVKKAEEQYEKGYIKWIYHFFKEAPCSSSTQWCRCIY